VATKQLGSESGGCGVVDYEIWGILQQRIYRSQICNDGHPKEQLIEEWRRFDRNIIDRLVNQWRDRLCKCISVKGGHFDI